MFALIALGVYNCKTEVDRSIDNEEHEEHILKYDISVTLGYSYILGCIGLVSGVLAMTLPAYEYRRQSFSTCRTELKTEA